MAIEAIGRAWRVTGMSMAERVLLVALADLLNAKTGQLNPSYQRLAEMTCMGRRSVMRVMERLLERGLVELVERGAPGRSNRYRLRLADVVPSGHHTQGTDGDGGTPRMVSVDPRMVSLDPSHGDRGAPDPERTLRNRGAARPPSMAGELPRNDVSRAYADLWPGLSPRIRAPLMAAGIDHVRDADRHLELLAVAKAAGIEPPPDGSAWLSTLDALDAPRRNDHDDQTALRVGRS